MSLYRQVLRQAFALIWHHKYLWFFGFFAAILGNEGEVGIIFKAYERISQRGPLFPTIEHISSTGIFSWQGLRMIGQGFIFDPFASFLTLLLAVIIIAVIVFVIWLIIISQAALINNSNLLATGKKATMQDGFDAGLKKFGPLLGINFLVKLIIFLLLFAVILPLFFASAAPGNAPLGDLHFIITFIIILPLAFIVSFIGKYAAIYLVLKKEKFWVSLEKGWLLLKRNWLITIETALLLFLATIIAGLAFFIIAFLIAIPFIILGIIAIAAHSSTIFFLIATIALVCIAIAMVLVGSLVASFHWASWTLLFNRLTAKEGALSRLQRWGNLLQPPGYKKYGKRKKS